MYIYIYIYIYTEVFLLYIYRIHQSGADMKKLGFKWSTDNFK